MIITREMIDAAAHQIHHTLGCTITAAEVAAQSALAAALAMMTGPSAEMIERAASAIERNIISVRLTYDAGKLPGMPWEVLARAALESALSPPSKKEGEG